MIDMTNNRVPYGLLTVEDIDALEAHEKAGGEFEIHAGTSWWPVGNTPWHHKLILRTVPLPKTQDVIAWEKLPEWVEWVARDMDGSVWCYEAGSAVHRRIDEFPGIVMQIGTCDWKDSKQRRPR
jgi:hypothetical protein